MFAQDFLEDLPLSVMVTELRPGFWLPHPACALPYLMKPSAFQEQNYRMKAPSWKSKLKGFGFQKSCTSDWAKASTHPLWVYVSSFVRSEYWARWFPTHSGNPGLLTLAPHSCGYMASTKWTAHLGTVPRFPGYRVCWGKTPEGRSVGLATAAMPQTPKETILRCLCGQALGLSQERKHSQ